MGTEEGFFFHFEGDVFLPLDNIWPDGDAPENPTSEDVVTLLHRLFGEHRGILRASMHDWDMDSEIGLDVDGRTVWL